MKNNNKILLLVIGTLLLITGGIAFAYFITQAGVNGEGAKTNVQTATLNNTTLTTEGTLEFNDTDIYPGHKNLSIIKMTATGNQSIIYNLIWTGTNSLQTPLNYKVYKTTTEINASITCNKKEELQGSYKIYYEECTETNFNDLGLVVASGTIGTLEESTKKTLIINESIDATEAGNVVYYYFVLEYPNLEESQNYDMGGSFSGILNAEILGEVETPIVNVSVESSTEASNNWYSEVKIKGVGSNSTNTVTSLKYCITSNDSCEPTTTANESETVVELPSNTNAQKVCFKALDNNNIESIVTCSDSYKVDSTTTTTTISLDDASISGENNWYKSAILNIEGNNSYSGITSIKYCVTSNDTCTPDTTVNGTSTSVTLESNVSGQKVCASSIDNKGTTSEIACSETYNVDSIKPEIEITNEETTTNSITLTLSGTDEMSGISKYYYKVNNGSNTESTSNVINITNLTYGTYTFEVYGVDVAGNTSDVITKEITLENPYVAREIILANVTLGTDTPNFANTSCSSGCEEATVGVYTAQDDDGTSYYFRGDVTNNYVKFANKYWRIIRINGDGSIRLIYDGTSARANGTSSTDTQIGTNYFNLSPIDNMYVGYMYTSGSVHGLGTNSTIKETLDNWFTSNLNSYTSYLDYDAGFCGDRTAYVCSSYLCSNSDETIGGGTGTTTTYYGTMFRHKNSQPSFKCADSSDLYTTSSSSKGNKALTHPIGLITADEVAYAGGYQEENSNYYLYTGQQYWTMSPYGFNGTYAMVYAMWYEGSLVAAAVTNNNTMLGVRPVINLRADTQFTGDGSVNSPFTVVGAS